MRKEILIALFIFICVFRTGDAQVFYRVERLPVNTGSNAEMAPVIYKNGVVFSSNRKSEVVLTTVDQEGNFTYDLYFSEKKGKSNWSAAGIFSKELTTRYNESTVCFSADENTMYYTATLNAGTKIGDASGDTLTNGIFISQRNGETWSVPEPFTYNSPDYDVGYPWITEDGNRLYFAARNPEGYGKFDLYYSDKVNGSWTKPVNLGPAINTAESEVFPFVYKQNRLYFASGGHDGGGGLDIFYSDFINGVWIRAVNLPRPFNSRYDDFGYISNSEMDTGYFTSNRRGTDDIYSFISAFPAFESCPEQIDETFCYEFYEAGTMVLDTTTLRYEWDLGDGTKIRDLRASHCFAGPGYYLVQLNVIDTLTGEIFFSEASYDLNIEPVEQPYITCPETIRVNQNTDFDASKSNIKSFRIQNYYWDFGDGGIENEFQVRHRYTKPGTFIIRLGITGPAGTESESEPEQKACASKKVVVISDR
jgi:hypothetical protein